MAWGLHREVGGGATFAVTGAGMPGVGVGGGGGGATKVVYTMLLIVVEIEGGATLARFYIWMTNKSNRLDLL
jgi:hypothetical protein